MIIKISVAEFSNLLFRYDHQVELFSTNIYCIPIISSDTPHWCRLSRMFIHAVYKMCFLSDRKSLLRGCCFEEYSLLLAAINFLKGKHCIDN